MDVREKLVELLSVDCCPNDGCDFCDYAEFEGCRPHFLADHLIANGVTLQENAEISDELFKRLRDAPITVGKEESSIEPVQEWIPVTERLPDENSRWVLCLCVGGAMEVLKFDYTMWNWDAQYPGRCYMENYVTHWMSLPEPPKEE